MAALAHRSAHWCTRGRQSEGARSGGSRKASGSHSVRSGSRQRGRAETISTSTFAVPPAGLEPAADRLEDSVGPSTVCGPVHRPAVILPTRPLSGPRPWPSPEFGSCAKSRRLRPQSTLRSKCRSAAVGLREIAGSAWDLHLPAAHSAVPRTICVVDLCAGCDADRVSDAVADRQNLRGLAVAALRPVPLVRVLASGAEVYGVRSRGWAPAGRGAH
jgi:hypothetical protein